MKLILLGLAVLATVATGNANQRIVGGHFAEPGTYTHQIALLKNGVFSCGGSIISNHYVLTAAHCVRGVSDPDTLTVVHGSNFWPNGTHAKVSNFTSHENFGDFKNDVALLKLVNPLVFDEFTNSVPLHKHEVPTNATVVISGFGRTGFNDRPSEQLKYNVMTVLSHKECAEKTGINYDGLICFNGPQDNGVCFGDSGGPALYNGELVGVANFAISGCGSYKPDGFAKVSYFVDWIQKHTNQPVLEFL